MGNWTNKVKTCSWKIVFWRTKIILSFHILNLLWLIQWKTELATLLCAGVTQSNNSTEDNELYSQALVFKSDLKNWKHQRRRAIDNVKFKGMLNIYNYVSKGLIKPSTQGSLPTQLQSWCLNEGNLLRCCNMHMNMKSKTEKIPVWIANLRRPHTSKPGNQIKILNVGRNIRWRQFNLSFGTDVMMHG